MRVVGGRIGGIPLAAVPGRNTRPTTDKVKEAMFNLLGQRLDGGAVLDLYAGSGALGIEALSRGADVVYAFERDKKAIETIRKNIAKTRVADAYHLFPGDNRRNLRRLREQEPALRFDWVFLDPPYRQQDFVALVKRLAHDWLMPTATVVCERSSDDTLPERIATLTKIKDAQYGSTRVVIYRNEGADDELV